MKRSVVLWVAVCALVLAGCQGAKTVAAVTPAASASPSPTDVLSPDSLTLHPQNSPTVDSPTPSGPTEAKFGDVLTITDPDSGGASLTVLAPSTEASELDGYETPSPGNQFVFFHVSFTASSSAGGFDYNPLDFYVRDATGQHYDPTGDHDPTLDSGTLNAGEIASGYITFDAPPHGTLVYSPNLGDESVAEWSY